VFLYLDLNCFNRPFDDQSQDRIAREAAAVFSLLHRIVDGLDQLAWSAVLEFENSQHPLMDRRTEIARWAHRAVVNVAISDRVSARAQTLTEARFGALDAAHVACAEAAACDCLLTCDDRFMRRARRVQLAVQVQNPVEYLEEQIHV
jgi:predicted nucleic acid-binding protein